MDMLDLVALRTSRSYYAKAYYTGDGHTTQYAVPFPFIAKEHVHVFVNETATAFTWNTDGTFRLAGPPSVGATVEVRRITPRDHRLVVHSDYKVITADALNFINLQYLYLFQEDMDLFIDIINAIYLIKKRIEKLEEDLRALERYVADIDRRLKEAIAYFQKQIDLINDKIAQINRRLNNLRCELGIDKLDNRITAIEIWLTEHGVDVGQSVFNYRTILNMLDELGSGLVNNASAIAYANDMRRKKYKELHGALTTEIQERQRADNTLQDNINNEARARSDEDGRIWDKINNLNFGNIGGKLGLDRTEGSLDASRVNGLVNAIKQNTVSEGEVSANGYAKFGNGLIIQWGVTSIETTFTEDVFTQNFPIAFPNNCFAVIMSMNIVANKSLDANYWPQLLSHNRSSFSYWYQAAENAASTDHRIEFVAFGN